MLGLMSGCNFQSNLEPKNADDQYTENAFLDDNLIFAEEVGGFVDINPNSTGYNAAYSLDVLIEEDKPVLINFFEPWCGPCMKELPDLERIYKEQDIIVVGFTADYYSYPESFKDKKMQKEWIPIEERISFPFFDGAQQYFDVRDFVETYASSIRNSQNILDEQENLLRGYPITLFLCKADNTINIKIIPAARSYDQLYDLTNGFSSCL